MSHLNSSFTLGNLLHTRIRESLLMSILQSSCIAVRDSSVWGIWVGRFLAMCAGVDEKLLLNERMVLCRTMMFPGMESASPRSGGGGLEMGGIPGFFPSNPTLPNGL